MMLAAAAALLLLASPPACVLPPLRNRPLPWKPDETLTYEFDIMGVIKAGEASMTIDRPVLGKIPIQARFRNTSVFAKIRKVSGTALSWIDPKSLRPSRYQDEVSDNGIRKLSDTRLPEQARQTIIEQQIGEQRHTATFLREGEVIDLLAMAYYLRAADLRPGDAICFDLVANRRYWRFRGQVALKPEPIESTAGIFDAVRVDATVTRADDATTRRALHLWISTDSRRLPVAAESEIDLGPVRALLSRVSP